MTNDEISALTQDVRSILVTNWGERVMHYNFGCNFREFLFEPIRGSELKSRIADRVLSQLAMWLPILAINELNIITSEDNPELDGNTIGIMISFSIQKRPDLKGKETFLINI